ARFVLEHFIRRRPTVPPPGLRDRLARARRFYTNPRFLEEPETFFATPRPLTAAATRVVPLPDGEVQLVSYESEFEAVFPEARGGVLDELERHGIALWWRHREPGHPAMLCVHGYGGGQLWVESLAFEALSFYRAGIDVVVYVLPYHGERTPPGSRHSGELFFDMDVVRTNEAFARAIYELRALARWLKDAGTGPVGAFGMSLGAYTAALLASVEPQLAFVAAMIPLVSFTERWWTEGTDDPWLATAIAHGWTRDGIRALLRVHEPTARPALVPHARRLIIGACADGICTPEHAEALWRHWNRPRIHWYRGGHLMQLGRRAALATVRALISDVVPSAAPARMPAAPVTGGSSGRRHAHVERRMVPRAARRARAR